MPAYLGSDKNDIDIQVLKRIFQAEHCVFYLLICLKESNLSSEKKHGFYTNFSLSNKVKNDSNNNTSNL